MHYDIISAFIKSIRGSDPDAAVYWLARLVSGGEDPKFIARRLVISAAEDVGLANPNALLLANATFDTVDKIGWPEARYGREYRYPHDYPGHFVRQLYVPEQLYGTRFWQPGDSHAERQSSELQQQRWGKTL
jgi:replication-associated recombination protein RarA